MKRKITKLGLLFFAIVGLSSCITEVDLPDQEENTPPTAAEFSVLEDAVLENLSQSFTLNVSDGYTTFTTTNGVIVSIDPACLTKNGNPVTGSVDFEIVEIFNRGNMLVANKPTTATTLTGEKKLLISGGEFYVNATQNGVQLATNCGFQINIPTSLTGGTDNDMGSFTGSINSEGELIWAAAQQEFWIGQGENGQSTTYNAFVQSFGWFNCDKFYAYSGPTTQISVLLPSGYNNENSNVFIAISGEPNTLGYLYGNFPVGLNCHIIFVTEEDGMFSYAIKSISSLPDGASYTFNTSELQTGTQAQVVAAINALP
jgi:hypothetical protein